MTSAHLFVKNNKPRRILHISPVVHNRYRYHSSDTLTYCIGNKLSC